MREPWLQSALEALRPDVEAVGLVLPPNLHISVGFPSTRALSRKRQRIGECWHAHCSADAKPHIFVSPLIDQTRVLDVLIHELLHATGIKGHRADFSKPARAIGLVAPWTSTTAGPDLKQRLNALIDHLGPYPHSLLTSRALDSKKQGTRLLKASCGCGYTVRLTRKWADLGLPGCPTCKQPMRLDV